MNEAVQWDLQNTTSCCICGSISYSWGDVEVSVDMAPGTREKAGLLGKLGFIEQRNRARVCNNCGNIQLFIRE